MPSSLRRTALYERHVELGAKLIEFAGWEMPSYYAQSSSPVRDEHMAVRGHAGIFDVSHMGEIETSGADATRLLQRLITNDLAKVPVGGAQYGLLCREDGGVLDDLFSYRLETDAIAHGHERRQPRARPGAVRTPRERARGGAGERPRRGLRDARGPGSARAGDRAGDLRRAAAGAHERGHRRLGAHEVLVCGTGYTGEEGVELLLAPRICARAVG